MDELLGNKKVAYEKGVSLQEEKKSLEAAIIAINETQGKCVINSQIKCDKDFTKFIEAKKTKIEELSIEIVNLAKIHNDLKKQVDDTQTKLNQESSLRENLANSERFQSQVNETIRKTNSDLQLKINDIQSFDKYKDLRIESKKKELETLQNNQVDPIAPTELMEMQKNALNGKISVLKTKLEEQERSKITLSNQKSASVDVKVAEYNIDCFKQLSVALGSKGIQGEIVKEMLDPIKEDVQENLRLMGLTNKFFFQMESDSGREVFQFGWINEKGYTVNFDTINSAHKSLLLVAILTAIVEKANPKLKILAIDDVEHIIDELFEEFIKGLNAIAHKWNNILLAVANSTLQVEGFKVWNLSRAV